MPLHVECGNAIGDSTILRSSTTSANIFHSATRCTLLLFSILV